MNRKIGKAIFGGIFVLAGMPGSVWQAQAKEVAATYQRIAPIDQYLMERNAEMELARSAAPQSISRDAQILVLGRHGYEMAAKGSNGFVCLVERSWMSPYNEAEFLNPDQRAPLCLNPAAVKSHMAFTNKSTELALAGLSKTQMFDALKAAYDKKQLPLPDPGAMCYMMSKQQYFSAKDKNADPHLMFWFPQAANISWGADLRGSPIYVHQDSPDPITTFIIPALTWSDGSPNLVDGH